MLEFYRDLPQFLGAIIFINQESDEMISVLLIKEIRIIFKEVLGAAVTRKGPAVAPGIQNSENRLRIVFFMIREEMMQNDNSLKD